MRFRRNLILGLALVSVGQLCCVSARGWADDAALEARVEALERQNQLLFDQLQRQGEAPDLLEPPLPLPGTVQMTSAQSAESICLPDLCDGSGDGKSKDDSLAMTAKWNHGLELQTKDKKFRVHIGGRTQIDAVWLQDNPNAFLGAGGDGSQDAVDFRRARIRIDGTMYEIIEWAAEFDFVNSVNDNQGVQAASESNVINVPVPTDLWFNIKNVPLVSNVTIGNQKEPIGFEHLESSRFLDFMERSFNQDAFTGPFNNGFTPGIMLWRNFGDDRGLIQTGFFKNTTNPFAYGIGDGEYASTSRLAYLLWKEDDGARLLHLGGAYSIRSPNNGAVQYRSRGSLRNGPGALNPVFANTNAFATDQVQLLGGEAALQLNSLLLQGEYIASWNSDAVGNGTTSPLGTQLGTVFVNGWYAEALYFLTGEHRDYEAKRGAFGRVIPNENVSWGKGLGAWQVGARYSRLDLQDGLMNGGLLQDVTLGINWFFNPNMKIQANYVYTMRDAAAGSPVGAGGNFSGFGMRLAQDY